MKKLITIAAALAALSLTSFASTSAFAWGHGGYYGGYSGSYYYGHGQSYGYGYGSGC